MVLNPLNPFESIESFESRENSDSLNPVPGRIQLNLNPASNLNPIQSNTGPKSVALEVEEASTDNVKRGRKRKNATLESDKQELGEAKVARMSEEPSVVPVAQMIPYGVDEAAEDEFAA